MKWIKITTNGKFIMKRSCMIGIELSQYAWCLKLALCGGW